jgi:PleD family two-component response regulator
LRPALVLIANDQEWSARSIESVLAPQGFAILRAFTGQQAIDRALAARPDLILLDAQLPDIHGFDVCRRLRDEPAIGHSVPIIITTAGPSGRQQRLEASRAGAWDFLGQPLDAELMLARVEAFVQATDAMRRSREDALVEESTGLYTARGLTRRLREVVADAARRRQPLACVVFTPEAIGGEAPDGETLTGLGAAFRRVGRESDVLGRLAEDEFVVVAPATGEAGARRLAERLANALTSELASLGVRLRTGVTAVEDASAARLDEQELLARASGRARGGNGNGSHH